MVELEPVYWSVPPLKTRLAAVAPVPSGLAEPAFMTLVPAGKAKATVPPRMVSVPKSDAVEVSESVEVPDLTRCRLAPERFPVK